MNKMRSIVGGMVACGVALSLVSTLSAQTITQGTAQVVRVKGGARYTTGDGVWRKLNANTTLKPGTVIQTALDKGSYVDLVLSGDGAVATGGSATPVVNRGMQSPPPLVYKASGEQNVVRLWENTLLGLDKLTSQQTGADLVTETQLDLKAGRIFGTVKKMAPASKYEIKLPNGVAGVRGTVYEITADGLVRVMSGSMVVATVGSDGTVGTTVVGANQQLDTKSGQVVPLPAPAQQEMSSTASQMRFGRAASTVEFSEDLTVRYVSNNKGKRTTDD